MADAISRLANNLTSAQLRELADIFRELADITEDFESQGLSAEPRISSEPM